MSLQWRLTAHRTWHAALLLLVYLAVRASTGPHGCPSVCSCSNQSSKVVCTRRGLTRVPPDIPPNARHLNLMENGIELIQADTFRHLLHLEVLQLGRNAIRQIEVGAFNGLASLNTLELFDNRLTVVPSGAFEYLSKLRELWLRNNPVESIPYYAFSRVPSLMRLDLGELRRLQYVSDGAFEGLRNLRYLNLRMCNLRELPVLSALVGLEELEVSENHFPTLRPGAFRGLGALRKLWVMNSQVSQVERNAFDDVASLVELNLAHNNLSSLTHDLFAPLGRLAELHLHHNPWNCDCDAVWLSRWLRAFTPTNSTCCGRCHAPPQMRGRYLVEVERGALRCSAPFIADAPRDLNVSAGRPVELRCRTAAASSVRWLLPNGTVLSHGAGPLRASVLRDGTLAVSEARPGDTGVYTCMVANAAGSSNASALLNVSGPAPELDTSGLSYFSTVTVETLGPSTTRPDSASASGSASGSASPSVFQPAFISTPTVLLQDTRAPPPPSPAPTATATGSGKPPANLDEVMKTTKIIIGCFVGVTLLAAVMLVVFYKLRKRHQRRSTVAAARTVEIIQVEEDVVPPRASAGRVTGDSYGRGYGGSYRAPHWTENELGGSFPRSRPCTITTVPESYTVTTHKDRVQETQI